MDCLLDKPVLIQADDGSHYRGRVYRVTDAFVLVAYCLGDGGVDQTAIPREDAAGCLEVLEVARCGVLLRRRTARKGA